MKIENYLKGVDELELGAAKKFQPSIEVKQEPEEGAEDIQIKSVPPREREINNTLPILHSFDNPSESLLHTEGEIDKIRCADWSFFPEKLMLAQKDSIRKQVISWLKLNIEDREAYKALLERYCRVAIPLDGPSRGYSVFANERIVKYTVIGPYAGALHLSDDSLSQAFAKQGSRLTLSYQFQTGSPSKHLDGYATGNVLTLINSADLFDGTTTCKNNLVALRFGKSISVYVALKDIEKGEEFFVSYGDDYDPEAMMKEVVLKVKKEREQ